MAYLGRVKPVETTASVTRATYTGDGSTTTFNLPRSVSNETEIVASVNGVVQQDAAYSTNGTQIIFDGAPALGDAIELRVLGGLGLGYAPPDGSVVTGKLADGAVTTGKIADNSITTAKIVPGAVIQADLATGVAGTGPAFYAFASAATLMGANAQTKINFQTESFDTNNNYDTTTSRFQPTVAGYYWIGATIRFDVANNIVTHIYINHNRLGTVGTGGFVSATQTQAASHGSTIAFFNGTTDYVEAAAFVSQAGNTSTGQGVTYFAGYLVRAA